MKTIDNFNKDGVVLLKDVLPENMIDTLRIKYDFLNETLEGLDDTKDEPLVVFWKHVVGETKRTTRLSKFPELLTFINDNIIPAITSELDVDRLQLLECIIFNKPAMTSNRLNWHQDVSYFPLNPNNQIAVWFPLESVNEDRGAMQYALGSHKLGAVGSTNLHTREPFENEDRPLIPEDPAKAGFEVKVFEMNPTDMLVHDGYVWHQSGPNIENGYTRRGISIRFITTKSKFDPRPGQGASFTSQISVNPGDYLPDNGPFPVLWKR